MSRTGTPTAAALVEAQQAVAAALEATAVAAGKVAALAEPRPRRRTGVQISLAVAPPLRAKADDLAARMVQSSAALINRAIYEMAERIASP